MAEVAGGLARFRSGHDLPALLKRAAGGSDQAAVNVCTEELYSSAPVSTGGSKRLQPAEPAEGAAKDAGRSAARFAPACSCGAGQPLPPYCLPR